MPDDPWLRLAVPAGFEKGMHRGWIGRIWRLLAIGRSTRSELGIAVSVRCYTPWLIQSEPMLHPIAEALEADLSQKNFSLALRTTGPRNRVPSLWRNVQSRERSPLCSTSRHTGHAKLAVNPSDRESEMHVIYSARGNERAFFEHLLTTKGVMPLASSSSMKSEYHLMPVSFTGSFLPPSGIMRGQERENR